MTRVPRFPATDPPRVACAVGRAAGGAVVRNRTRRRLRAALRARRDLLVPGSVYLVAAGPGADRLPFAELERTLDQLLRRA